MAVVMAHEVGMPDSPVDPGLGRTRMKMLRFLMGNPELDDGGFIGEVYYNVHNVSGNVSARISPAAKPIHFGEETE